MYSLQTQSPDIMTSSDYHLTAAGYHEDAAASHRNAAAHYNYGNYQEASEQAKLAEECARLALQHCGMGTK